MITLVVLFVIFCSFNVNAKVVQAEQLSDSVNEQLEKLDFSTLDEFFENIDTQNGTFDFVTVLNQILKGEGYSTFDSFSDYVVNSLLYSVKQTLPTFISILIIAILCGLIKNFKSHYVSDGVQTIVVFACVGAIIIVLFSQFISIWNNCIFAIKNIGKLCEIMSPIIVTLMVAIGANVSASVYTPSVAFFSTGIISVVLSVVLPLTGLMVVFSIINNLSSNIKLTKFIEFFSSIIKWVLGIIIAIFGLFLSVQGIASAIHDGISIKATKYAISNSIPIVGGLLKDGFDVVIAGSVLIKNAVGVVCLFGLFFTVLSPILSILSFSLMLKLVVAIAEPITDEKIIGICSGISKGITTLCACVILTGLALFLVVLLSIISANAFI